MFNGSSWVLIFATAHSRGLRRRRGSPQADFATAHSRGLRRFKRLHEYQYMSLCHSAFARVATRQVPPPLLPAWFCHSAFVRVATPSTTAMRRTVHFATAHSCGLRRIRNDKGRKDGNLCHSAFVRVATRLPTLFKCALLFATAHSCGLRRIGIKRQYYTYAVFATAHSCGLRHAIDTFFVSSDIFATAHSCGLRRLPHTEYGRMRILCHSAFVRVATRCGLKKRGDADLCHSAFVRVATLLNQKKLWCGFFATAHSCGLRQATVLTQ